MKEQYNVEMTFLCPLTEEQYNLLMEIMTKAENLNVLCCTDFNVYDDSGELTYSETVEPIDVYVQSVNNGTAEPF